MYVCNEWRWKYVWLCLCSVVQGMECGLGSVLCGSHDSGKESAVKVSGRGRWVWSVGVDTDHNQGVDILP